MRGIKKIEHIMAYPTLYSKSVIASEIYRITYEEGRIFVTQKFFDLPKKAKKFFCRKYNYHYSFNQNFSFGITYTTKTDTYTFKDPI